MTRLVKIACLVATGVSGVALLLALGSPPPVDRGFKNANLDGARTEAEVVAILGPPGSYATVTTTYQSRHVASSAIGRSALWRDDYATVTVYFRDPEGSMTYWYGGRALVAPQRPWHERLLDYLRDLWN